MKTERRLYATGRENCKTSRCLRPLFSKAGCGLARRALVIAALASAAWCAHGGVWQDCVAWYMGGTDKDNDGVFDDGELTDIRHAAIADSPTHGGGVRTNNPGASNRVETVVSATSGRTFPNVPESARDLSRADSGHNQKRRPRREGAGYNAALCRHDKRIHIHRSLAHG